MQTTPYLRPTVIQHLRAFLAEQDPIPPWSTSGDVLDHLYGMLHARCDDPDFWVRLHELSRDLQDDLRRGRAEGLPAREAEVLTDQQIAGLIDELHAALRSNGHRKGPGAMRDLLAGRSAALAACVTVLGAALAMGCNPRSPESPTTQDAPSISPDPALAAAPDASPDTASDALVQLFRDGSPDDIAAKLEALVDGGVDAVIDASPREAGRPVVGNTPPPRPKPAVQPVPRYKGVTF
jgi:hypothetical protein